MLGDKTVDYSAVLPSFINTAIRDIQRKRFWTAMETYSTFSTVIGQNEYQLNTVAPRYIASEVMKLGAADGAKSLLLHEHSWETFKNRFIRTGEEAENGKPVTFIIHSTQGTSGGQQSLYLFPTPDAVYTVEFWYKQFLPDLVNDGDTNWFTENIPDCIKYRACHLSALFLREDPARWERLFFEVFSAAYSLDAYAKMHKASIGRSQMHDYGVEVDL